jgi:ParB family chromosome partitioning protein
MAKKNALGRGLGALIDAGDTNSPTSERPEKKEVLQEFKAPSNEIKLKYIQVNPYQPRTHFDEDALVELSSSIKELGVIQPITVREIGPQKYQLITGERRFRASKISGLETIPAFIRKADDQAMLEMALVENIQREDLDAIEVALSYQRLIEEIELTQENLSLRVGKKRSTIANYLRLLKLPPEIQAGIKERKISMGHARALVNVENTSDQIAIFKKIVSQELSVRNVEELARKINLRNEEEPVSNLNNNQLPEEYEKLKKHLSDYFKTKIEFKRGNNGEGKIVIPFKTDSQLEHIIGVLDKLNT